MHLERLDAKSVNTASISVLSGLPRLAGNRKPAPDLVEELLDRSVEIMTGPIRIRQKRNGLKIPQMVKTVRAPENVIAPFTVSK